MYIYNESIIMFTILYQIMLLHELIKSSNYFISELYLSYSQCSNSKMMRLLIVLFCYTVLMDRYVLLWHCIIVICLIIYSCHDVSSCSHYVSVSSVTSYAGYRATYRSCGWWGRRRCRDGLVWCIIPLEFGCPYNIICL